MEHCIPLDLNEDTQVKVVLDPEKPEIISSKERNIFFLIISTRAEVMDRNGV